MESTSFSEEYLRSIDVHTILPQQEPFVMVGNLISFSSESATTETEIKSTNIFVDNGCFSPAGMMENIAQTCATRVGFYNKCVLHNEVQLGFIGAVRNYIIYDLPPVGTTIQTTIEILKDIFGMTLANAKITSGDKIFAEAEIKLSVKTVE